MQRFVIVGANLAGATAAGALRKEGFEGRVVLIGEEPHPPYERPPLSKQYLRGEQPFEKALVHPPGFYKDQSIETMFGTRATSIDVESRKVFLDHGDAVPYDRVLITTGSRNRTLEIPGIELEGVFHLRSVEDSDKIKTAASKSSTAVVIGMGFIGAEVAASLRQLGLKVSVVEPMPVPLGRAIGNGAGRILADIHRDHGVDLHFEDSVESIEGNSNSKAVLTARGERLEADFVVVGVGITPATEVVTDSPVIVDNGIVVDERCRTNVEHVFAAGDVTNHFHPLPRTHMRVEHWQNAIKQAEHAAAGMVGKDVSYSEVHWFWSDQYEHNIQWGGFPVPYETTVVRGSPEDRSFVTFYLSRNRPVAVLGINRGKEVRQAMRIIRTGIEVDQDKLRDTDVDLKKLIEAT